MSDKEYGIRLDVNLWTYQDFVDFTSALQSGNNAVLFDLAARIIVAWDYPVKLSEPEPLMELGVIESGRVVSTVFNTLSNFIEDLDTSDVTVDFGKWNTRRFLTFDEARRDGKVRKAEEMMSEIVTFKGRDPFHKVSSLGDFEDVGLPELTRLSFEDGSKAFKAVNEAYSKLVTGKT